MRTAPTALLLFAASLVPTTSAIASEPPELAVALEGQQAVFHVGERIPLILSFTGPANQQFEFNNASYDRGGRMTYEQFEVEPHSGWRDPLETYFGSTMGFAGGGLSGISILSPTPSVLHLDLNEWVRFDKPGNYIFVIKSQRVVDRSQNKPLHWLNSNIVLKSNPIHIEIIPPESGWQRAKFAEILETLTANPETPGMQRPAREAALADMRYLGTSQAAEWLAQHLREDEPATMNSCAFGLMGLHEVARPKAIAAMNKLILNPKFPISSWFQTTLSVLQVTSQDPEEQRTERRQLNEAIWRSILDVLPSKQPAVKALTAQMLNVTKPQMMTQEMQLQLNSVLQATLEDLPPEKQAYALQNEWTQIKSPALLPTLQSLAKIPLRKPGSNLFTDYTTRQLKAVALQRWYELDPDSARQEALEQIGSAQPSLTAESLYFLGEQSLPQFEDTWAQAFISTTDEQQEALFASLLANFGTGSATQSIIQKVEQKIGGWACAPQAAALGYLVKFDPVSARPLVDHAIQARGPGKSACNHSTLSEIATFSHNPMLGELALQSLNDPDHEVTTDALLYLTSYGQASDEQPISDRYTLWSQQWQGRSEELESRDPGSLSGNWQEIGFGEMLARALIANQGWLASEKLIQSTIEKCVEEQVCNQVKQLADLARFRPYVIKVGSQGPNENYEIAQYSTKSFDLFSEKLIQFPKGTQFLVGRIPFESEAQKQSLDNILETLKEDGMIAVLDPN